MQIVDRSIFYVVVWLIVILSSNLIAANNLTLTSHFHRPREHHLRGRDSLWVIPYEETKYKHLTYREMQTIIRLEGGESNAVDCCPTVEEMIEPLGGRNRQDMYVELYRDGENTQRFFEYSCRPDILEKPCRFVDRKLSEQSRCVQKYSYTYAIVQNPVYEGGARKRRHDHHKKQQFPSFASDGVGNSPWMLDYIKVRSGCSCEITPKPRRKSLPQSQQAMTQKSKRKNK